MKEVLEYFKNGGIVIVTDNEDRENEGDFILLGEKSTPEKIALILKNSSGVICAAVSAQIAQKLELPFMVKFNQDQKKTAYTVSVDVRAGMTTGISATERSNTIRALANPSSKADDFVRPGHVFPLVAVRDGLTARQGHTEAGVLMAQLVGASPVSAIAEVVTTDGLEMARGDELRELAEKYQMPIITITQLELYLKQNQIEIPSDNLQINYQWAQLPRETGLWKIAIHPGRTGGEHAILKYGEVNQNENTLVRLHSECLTGDALGSQRCDCGPQLEQAFNEIEMAGAGYIIYLHDHEGRGIGLKEKIKSYLLQDQGLDTVDANLELGHQADERNWEDAKDILVNLGLTEITLLTNNPAKVEALSHNGIKINRQDLEIQPNQFNRNYLETKAKKMAHLLRKLGNG
jgi:3,4-dihydroxy 2-butanone 4-phosphate synthase/GTP cyclohydrolase II